jgi:(p)ppGpp synthase/HD superfamily hydrolase
MNLQRAIEIATEAHKNQNDRYGAPFLEHVTRVMNAGKTEDEKMVGVLHDIIEKTDWDLEKLRKQGFEEHIIEAVRCLTKASENEDYDQLIERAKLNALAVKVKLNDLTDNMDIKRMREVTEEDLKRLNKYLKAYHLLASL